MEGLFFTCKVDKKNSCRTDRSFLFLANKIDQSTGFFRFSKDSLINCSAVS